MRLLVIFCLSVFAGCAAIDHLDEALVLKAYSDEKESQERYVKRHDALFEEMLRQSKEENAFREYDHKAGFVRTFGEPVLCRAEGALEKCVYRRMIKPLESPRIYLYFNENEQLVRWQAK